MAFDFAAIDSLASEPFPNGIDRDGVRVTTLFANAERGWYRMSLATRQALSRKEFENPLPTKIKKERVHRAFAKRFSTQYAIEFGLSHGWRLMDRERYDPRLKRHHDLMLGVDAIFAAPFGLVGIQGAGLGEMTTHWEKFLCHGGAMGPFQRAREINMRILYIEFERGQKEPRLIEEWGWLE